MAQNDLKRVMLLIYFTFITVAQCSIMMNHQDKKHLFWHPVVQLHLYGLYSNDTHLSWVKVPISELDRYSRNYPWQDLRLILQLHGSEEVLRLSLVLSRMDPFPVRFLHQTFNSNQTSNFSFTSLPKAADNLHLCHYRTPSESQYPHGVFNLCNCQVSGTLFLSQGETVAIEPMNYKRAGNYGYTYHFAQLHSTKASLQTDELNFWHSYNAKHSSQFRSTRLRRRRKRRSSIQLSRKIKYQVDLYLVVDYFFLSVFDDRVTDKNVRKPSTKQTMIRVLQLLNHVNRAYEQLGIVFIVVGLDILTSTVPSYWDSNEASAEQLIDGNKNYVLENLAGKPIEYDCVHFIFGREQPLNGMKVGFANTKTMCSRNDCLGFTTDYKGRMAMVTSIVMAHELGHNFGLQHDNIFEDCSRTCRVKKCIMFDSLYYANYDFIWSQCSRNDINDLLSVGLEMCLQPRPNQTLMDNRIASTCGNGIVEETEQCDCGSDKVCNCCDMVNCRFKALAECAIGTCCDVSRCKFQPAGHLCRTLRTSTVLNVGGGVCDLEEHCTGDSEWCPPDLYKHDGTPCQVNNVKSHCFVGQCRSRETQCQLVWGQTGLEATSDCFRSNGQLPSNDDRDKSMRKVVGCVPQNMYNPTTREKNIAARLMEPCVNEMDRMCGRLWCTHRNEKTLIYGRNLAIVTQPQDNGLRCHATTIDFSSAPMPYSDPGLVPDGAACGINNERICINSTCKPVSQILQNNCACNGHGVCNNLQQCYCDSGWLPPNCAEWDGCSSGYQHTLKLQCHGASRVVLRNGLLVLFLVVIPIGVLAVVCLVRNRDAVKRRYRSIAFRRPTEDVAGAVRKEGVTEPLQPSTDHPIAIVNASVSRAQGKPSEKKVDAQDGWRKDARGPERYVKYEKSRNPDSTTVVTLGCLYDDTNPRSKKLDVSAPIFQSSTNRDLSRTPALNKSSIAVTNFSKQSEEKVVCTPTKVLPTRPPPRPWPPIKT